jgi:NADH:ubiquinone oxidoreductase subunit E
MQSAKAAVNLLMSKFTIPNKTLYICTGSKCAKRGGKSMYKLAKAYAKHHDDQNLEVVRTDCTDRCDYAPVCALQPGNTWLKEYHEKEVLKLLGF